MEEKTQNVSFMPTTVTNSVIVGAAVTIVSIIGMYVSIMGEPSGSLFGATSILPAVTCLISAVAAVLSVKAYAKLDGVSTVTLGNGAVIGLVAGLITGVVGAVVSQIWMQLIDPSLMSNFADYMIKNMEMAFTNMGMPAEQIDISLGEMEKSFAEQNTLVGILKGFAMSAGGYAVINLISGLITAKIVAKD